MLFQQDFNRDNSIRAENNAPLLDPLPDYLPHLWEGIKAGYLRQTEEQGKQRIGFFAFLGLGTRASDYYAKKQQKEERKRLAQLKKASKNRAHEDTEPLVQDEVQERPEALKIKRWGFTFSSDMFEKDSRPKGIFKRLVGRLFHVKEYYHYCALLKDLEPLGLSNDPESFKQVKYRNSEARKEWWFSKSRIERFSEGLWNKQMQPLFNKKASRKELLDGFNKVHVRVTKAFEQYNQDQLEEQKPPKNPAEVKTGIEGIWKAIGYQLGFNVQRVTRLLAERFFTDKKTTAHQGEANPINEAELANVSFQTTNTPQSTPTNTPPDSDQESHSLSSQTSEVKSEGSDTPYARLRSHSNEIGSTESLASEQIVATSSPRSISPVNQQPESTVVKTQPELSLVPHPIQNAPKLPASPNDIFTEDYYQLKFLLCNAAIDLWSNPNVSEAELETKKIHHLKLVATLFKNLARKYHSDKGADPALATYIYNIATLNNEIKNQINAEYNKAADLIKKRASGTVHEKDYQEIFADKQASFEAEKQKLEEEKLAGPESLDTPTVLAEIRKRCEALNRKLDALGATLDAVHQKLDAAAQERQIMTQEKSEVKQQIARLTQQFKEHLEAQGFNYDDLRKACSTNQGLPSTGLDSSLGSAAEESGSDDSRSHTHSISSNEEVIDTKIQSVFAELAEPTAPQKLASTSLSFGASIVEGMVSAIPDNVEATFA